MIHSTGSSSGRDTSRVKAVTLCKMCSQVHDLLRTGHQAPAVPSWFIDRTEVQGASGSAACLVISRTMRPPRALLCATRSISQPGLTHATEPWQGPHGTVPHGVVVMLLLHGTCQLLHNRCSVTLRTPWLSIPRGRASPRPGLSAELRGCCLHHPAQRCPLPSSSFLLPPAP